MSVSFALIAELTRIDGKPLVYENVLEMDLDDVLALEAEVTGVSEGRENFPNPAASQRNIENLSPPRNHRTYRLRIPPHGIGNDGDRRTLILGQGYLRLPNGRSAYRQWRSITNTDTDGAVMSKRLYAGNLNFEMTDSLLRQTFAQIGGVENAEVVRDRWTGISRGFGFVEMMTGEDAETAVGELNGFEVMGRELRVALAKPRGSDRNIDRSVQE